MSRKVGVLTRSILVLGLAIGLALASKTDAIGGERFAFIVDNSNYSNTTPLGNPAHDAEEITKNLKSLGFDVFRRSNLTADRFASELEAFIKHVQARSNAQDRTLLFYYAGHGMQYERQNLLVGVDARLESPTRLRFETYRLDDVIDVLERNSSTTLVFWDACRNNPLLQRFRTALVADNRKRSADSVRASAAEIDARPGNTLVAFSAAPGTVAYDGEGRMSPFAESLVRHMPAENVEIEVMLKRVAREVLSKTEQRQRPERVSQLIHDFYFRLDDSAAKRLEQQIKALENRIAFLQDNPARKGPGSDPISAARDAATGPTTMPSPATNSVGAAVKNSQPDPSPNSIPAPEPRDHSNTIDKFPLKAVAANLAMPRRIATSSRNQIAAGMDNGDVWLFEMKGMKLVKRIASREKSRVAGIDFSPDGKRLVIAYRSGKVYVMDVAATEPLNSMQVRSQELYSVGFNPDFPELYLAAGGSSETFAWSIKSGATVTKVDLHDGQPAFAIAFKPRAKSYFVSGGGNGTISYRPKTGTRRSIKAHSGAVRELRFSEQGDYMVSGGDDQALRLWRDFPADLNPVRLEGHKKYVLAIAISPNGDLIASGGGDKMILVWDAKAGIPKMRLSGHRQDVEAISFSRDGKFLLSGSEDRSLRLWDLTNGRELARIYLEGSGDRFVGIVNQVEYFGSPNLDGLFESRDYARSGGDEPTRYVGERLQ